MAKLSIMALNLNQRLLKYFLGAVSRMTINVKFYSINESYLMGKMKGKTVF
jgi:hypothetical protein